MPELNDNKRELQIELFGLIKKFEQENEGVQISGITIHRHDLVDCGLSQYPRLLNNISLTVEVI
jgi:hypothetical protein